MTSGFKICRIAALLCFAFVSCTSTTGESTQAVQGGKRAIFSEMLDSDYEAWFDEGTQKISIQMTWIVRFGRQLQTVAISDLDLSTARISHVGGGAFYGTELVVISSRQGNSVTVASWPSSVDEALAKEPGEITRTGEIHFHCKDRAQAQRAVRELRELQK